jgi:hypothetical protein
MYFTNTFVKLHSGSEVSIVLLHSLHYSELGQLASFGSWLTTRDIGVVLGLSYANRGCSHRLRGHLHETRMLASCGGSVMRNEAICFVSGFGYMG